MIPTIPFKRLILRAVLRQVSPMVIRLLSVPDHLELPQFHNVMRALLGWDGNLGYILRIHGQEFNSFRRKTRSKALQEFQLHRQEKFLYICDTLHLWEWEIRVVDIQEGAEEEHTAICLGGRGAAPPEFCSGPTGYRLMLKRQRREAALCHPGLREAGIQLLAEACPEESAGTWDLLRTTLEEGLRSIDRRLEESGPLEPERFHLAEANERLAALQQRSFRS
jgi:Plasmid pRiA4b ORF-3-like protein